MGFYPNTAGVYSVYPVPVVNDVFQSSYYRGGMLGFREYSVALSSTDIEALYDEYRYLRESIVATGGIALSLGGYVKPDLTVNISGIPPTLSKENVQYEYAFGSG